MKHRNKIMIGVLVLILSIVTVIMFSQNGEESIVDKNIPPENKALPLLGTWEVTEHRAISDSADAFKDVPMYISDGLIAIGDRFTVRPSFKAKYVNVPSYLKYKYNDIEVPVSEESDYTTVITVSDGQRFYQDIFTLDENRVIVVYNGNLYFYEKKSDAVPEDIVKDYEEKYFSEQQYSDHSNEQDLAVLLGVRRISYNESDEATSSYRTYFIRLDEENCLTIYQARNIFLPRANGFWDIVYRNETTDDLRDSQNTISVTKVSEDIDKQSKNKLITSLPLRLDYAGPNFMATSTKNADNSVSYRIYSLDNILEAKPLSIEEIAGDEGLKALREQIVRNVEESTSSGEGADLPGLSEQQKRNIGLERSAGSWKFVTNIKISGKEEKDTVYRDMDLNIVPNIDIAQWSELPIRWSNVRNLVPTAIDAVASPGGRLLIVQDVDELLIYDLAGHEKLLATIPMTESDTLIMSEWALGSYPENWEEQFRKTDRIPVQFQQE